MSVCVCERERETSSNIVADEDVMVGAAKLPKRSPKTYLTKIFAICENAKKSFLLLLFFANSYKFNASN